MNQNKDEMNATSKDRGEYTDQDEETNFESPEFFEANRPIPK